MTRDRNRVTPRAIAVAIAALLLLGTLGLTACSLDPDGGKSVPMSDYAPMAVKKAILESLAAEGFVPDNPNATYVTYASKGDTSTVLVVGTFYGPSKAKGVLATYKEIKVTVGPNGVWKVTSATEGVAAPEPKPEAEGEGAEAGAAEEKAGQPEGAAGEATPTKE
jgi:hypothetical protein